MALNTPIELDQVKPRRSRIHRIGVELEGGWATIPPRTQLIHDGSVQFERDITGQPQHVGELPSPPLDRKSLIQWMKIYYPSHVNATCGMHVHLSFETAFLYQQLMEKEYPSTVVEYFKKWATKKGIPNDNAIWDRLNGKSTYCQHVFMADVQAMNARKNFDRARGGHRYTVINYCWSRLKTLECRLLPMMPTVDEAIEALDELISITDRFLVTSTKKESLLKVSTEDDLDSAEVEEVNEVV